MNKKASILINTFNHEKYIEECLESCLNQNYSKELFEIIIVDDSSTDKTQQILQRYKSNYSLIKLILSKENLGQGETIRKGLEASKSDYLILLDGDDFMHKDRLNKVIDTFEANEDVGIIVNNRTVIFESKKESYKKTYLENVYRYRNLKKLSAGQSTFETALYLHFNTSSISLNKKHFKKILPLPGKIANHLDLYILSLSLYSSYIFINEKLSTYRVHSENFFVNSLIDRNKVKIIKKNWDAIIKKSKELNDYNINLLKIKRKHLRQFIVEMLLEKNKISKKQYIKYLKLNNRLSQVSLILLFLLTPKQYKKLQDYYLKTKYFPN